MEKQTQKKKYPITNREDFFDLNKPIQKERKRMFNLLDSGKIKLSTVYLIRCNDMYKIGFSDCPIKRLLSLQIGNPYELDLIWEDEVPNFLQIERGLHQKFESKRVIGEWFKLDKEDVEFILSLK